MLPPFQYILIHQFSNNRRVFLFIKHRNQLSILNMNIIQPTQKRKAHSTLGEDQENAFSQSVRNGLSKITLVNGKFEIIHHENSGFNMRNIFRN